jgi:predicted enzyme related to lactoylglutathione lyase
MGQRDGYIPGVPCWVDTAQPDPEAAADFYRGLFGWEFENAMPPEAGSPYLIGRLHGGTVAAVGPIPESMPQMAVWNTYIAVADADEAASKVREAGGKVVIDPFDVMDAGRMAVLTDPEGAALSVWQANQHIGAQVVNEAGSVNFNDLHTRDVEGAKAFYGAVFGWQVLGMGGSFQAWILPGYGDHLERNDPGLRERMADTGAPPRFEDVVASIVPIGDDQPDIPAHWGVTFAVDDADATAAKATELGGTVIAPPFDAPWVRMTVLADPHGATFVASQFVPENKDLPG